MAKNLLNKYVWLVDTIYKAKLISYDDINLRLLDNDMSEGKPLPLRTFHKWRIAIEEMFGLIIENEQGGKYRYYILNAEELKNGSMRSWLFNTLTVSNLMMENVSIKDKVLFEEIPDGEQYLPTILEALKKYLVLEITYQSFSRDEENTFEIEPLCLKAVFRCYQMDYPDYPFFCTCVASRKAFPQAENHQLHTISEFCGYHLANHHHALADAEACAWIAREIL